VMPTSASHCCKLTIARPAEPFLFAVSSDSMPPLLASDSPVVIRRPRPLTCRDYLARFVPARPNESPIRWQIFSNRFRSPKTCSDIPRCKRNSRSSRTLLSFSISLRWIISL
jgi:hypothetical protein